MIDRIDKLVFYFTIECSICHNKLKVSHVVIEEQQASLTCSLCGKTIKVPEPALLIKAGKDLNEFLGNKINQKFVKLTMNEFYVPETDTVPAH